MRAAISSTTGAHTGCASLSELRSIIGSVRRLSLPARALVAPCSRTKGGALALTYASANPDPDPDDPDPLSDSQPCSPRQILARRGGAAGASARAGADLARGESAGV